MELLKTNKFEVMDMPGMNTVAFLVNKDEEAEKRGEALLSLQKIEPAKTEVDGQLRKTFSVLKESDDEKELVVLLTLTNSKAILSTGELTSNGFSVTASNIPLRYSSILNRDDVEYKEVEYNPNLKRNFAIIDTETGNEVKPSVYMDSETGSLKGRCKIMPNKPYVVLELRFDEM